MEKRLFVGIKIEPSDELIQLISSLRKNLGETLIKWTEINNLHLTLVFLGDVNCSVIPEIVEKLKINSQNLSSFDVSLIGLGKFSKNKQANVIWAGYKDEGQLAKMAEKIALSMSRLGFERESRPFKAHLTLGRIKAKCNEEILNYWIIFYMNKIIQELKINHLILFESVLKTTGTLYKIIERIHF